MARYDAVKNCAICGRDLDHDEWVRVVVQHVKLYPRGRYWKQKTRYSMPQMKVCKDCEKRAVAGVKSMEVQHG